MRRLLLVTICGLGLMLLPATGAAADGGPVPPVQGGTGTTAPGSEFTFIALGTGNGNTIVQRVRRNGGVVERYRRIPGSFGVPGVAFDGSTTGLSADGKTLVLAEYTRIYPPTRTRLVVLDPVRLRERARIAMRGAYVVDVISPDGRWLYFTHYKSPTNSVDYEVRAYDLQSRHMVEKPIVDPREPDEKMQGLPVTRLMSPDGRWAYTLYSRGDEEPFIHALDTQNRTAACIDLPLTSYGNDIFKLRLRLLPGGTLRVEDSGTPVALVNTRTFAVSHPARAEASKQAKPPGGVSGFPWELMAIPAAAALAGLGVLARRRRRLRSAPA